MPVPLKFDLTDQRLERFDPGDILELRGGSQLKLYDPSDTEGAIISRTVDELSLDAGTGGNLTLKIAGKPLATQYSTYFEFNTKIQTRSLEPLYDSGESIGLYNKRYAKLFTDRLWVGNAAEDYDDAVVQIFHKGTWAVDPVKGLRLDLINSLNADSTSTIGISTNCYEAGSGLNKYLCGTSSEAEVNTGSGSFERIVGVYSSAYFNSSTAKIEDELVGGKFRAKAVLGDVSKKDIIGISSRAEDTSGTAYCFGGYFHALGGKLNRAIFAKGETALLAEGEIIQKYDSDFRILGDSVWNSVFHIRSWEDHNLYYGNFSLAKKPTFFLAPSFDGSVKIHFRGQEASENYLLWSEAFDNAVWVKSNVIVTANSVTAPDGSLTADTLDFSTVAGSQISQDTGINPANLSGTFSVWLKSPSGTTQKVKLKMSNNVDQTFEEVVTVPDEWTRFNVKGSFNATPGSLVLIIHDNDSATAFSVYAWGAQVHEGTWLKQYVKTESTAATQPERKAWIWRTSEKFIYDCGTDGIHSFEKDGTVLATFGSGLQVNSIKSLDANAPLNFSSKEEDSSSAVAFSFDTDTSFVTSGAKLLSVKNLGTEKFSVDKDGKLKSAYGIDATKLQTRDVATTAPSGGQVLTWNATTGQWEPRSVTATAALPKGFLEGLRISQNSTYPTHQLDISVGSCRDDSNSVDITVDSTITIDLTVSGANGLDTGTEAADTWYYIWICKGPSGVCGLFSLSPTSPVLPTGYDQYKRRIGVVKNDSASDIFKFYQYGKGREKIYYWDQDIDTVRVIWGWTGWEWYIADCSSFVPPISEEFIVCGQLVGSYAVMKMKPYGWAQSVFQVFANLDGAGGGSATFRMPIVDQKIDFFPGDGVVDIYVVGYIDEV